MKASNSRLKRGRPGDRVGRVVVGVGDFHPRGADDEADLGLAENGAGYSGSPVFRARRAGKTVESAGTPKNGTAAPLSSRRSARNMGQPPALRRLQKRPRSHRGLRQKAALVKEGAQFARLFVDKGIAQPLIDAGKRGAHQLAGVRNELPVAEMQPADHARSAADDFVELFLRLEADALLGGDLLE